MDLRRFTATRDRILGEVRERHPFEDLRDVSVLTRADVTRIAAVPGWATRHGPGSWSFDWSIAERALNRPLGPLEQRMLRESVMSEPDEESEVDELVADLDTLLGD